MNAVLDWMNSPAATLLGAPVSWIEVIGFVTGAACVYGVARQKSWNWPVGIVNNVAFIVLFFGAGLYGETLLQAVFAAVSVYGWYNWVRGAKSTDGKGDLPIRDGRRAEIAGGLGAVVLATVGIAQILLHGTDSQVPWPDAFVLAASLLATFWQAKKIFQHWYVWIVIDLVSIPLYFSRGLNLTAILYIGFTALCVYGLAGWTRTRKAAETSTGMGKVAA
ncbi:MULTISPECIES: nicotinamide riboside transporter PnuC [unclassified Arthrobacter]|uniref:nicotinamide riboside transporter PnuC n=1 Tax=unclassified Arthrobacter TaxID=235627 RepID=UPI001D14F299|nr:MULTISPECIES: nicotinamide riboside transporter PnuC [unclassified Arthrobacter]MCC3274988.1 nicotinamide riboside transporter PnuC [Arthrobacter sp. zg-Y20]MCC3279040.1 nicotinamide riboside transporter PnuC [Arthrobacter sp. zg-Y40]MCC9177415.1 nicotinamide riboside transporter PnuC [Arthrobacter sp. zg-Y750]MDK1315145.1 nicotinamide riboside transporter PnuC [Arthrobacter sp. zg.Y20]MDK1328006.1 nicotinamide riboside transporter PnuC [Arthrobacter sp. zg-Y1143]